MSDQFWTLYDFTENSAYPPFKRIIQNRLRQRMENLAQMHPEWDVKDYEHYFVEILNDDSQPETEKRFAHWHLLAYFDRDRCYLIWRNWYRLPFYASYAEDLYALTNEHLCNREKLRQYLNKYKASNDHRANLKTYMVGVLRNVMRQHINWKSKWHLLCDVDINSCRKFKKSEDRLRQALLRSGSREKEVSQYLFAWRYFVPIYKSNRVYHPNRIPGEKWPEPEFSDFAETAKYYNYQRFQPTAPLQVAVGTAITPAIIEQWMNICVEALRQSSQIIEVDFDGNQNEQPDNKMLKYWTASENQEKPAESLQEVDLIFRVEIEQIEQNLDSIRSQIPKSCRQAVMPLCYPHRWALLTQEQLSSKIGVNQGTISRYISKYVEVPLLEKFQELISERINPSDYAKTFLTQKFPYRNSANLIEAQLMDAIADLDAQSQQILKLSYGQQMNIIDLTRTLSQENPISHEEVKHQLTIAHNKLARSFSNLLNQWQSKYVKSWLKSYYQNLIQSGLLKSFEQLGSLQQEILWLQYTQKQNTNNILKPNYNTCQTLTIAKQELQRTFLWWIDTRFGLSLETETQQVEGVVEAWLSKNLLYLELWRN